MINTLGTFFLPLYLLNMQVLCVKTIQTALHIFCPKKEAVAATSKMSYQLYRNTTLGNCLQESLDELIQSQQISPELALRVLLEFDKAINNALGSRIKNRVTFKGHLNTYRFCDNVWTFVLSKVEFRNSIYNVDCDKVKIVACDGKNAAQKDD